MDDPDAAGRALLGIATGQGGNQIKRLSDTSSKAEYIATINSLVEVYNRELILKVYSDGTTHRMMVGYQKDGWGVGKDYGIKISEEGIDVLVADDADLLFKLAY